MGDENWKPGPDYRECQDQQIVGFPTIKFFKPGAKIGDDFYLERTADKLVNFAKTGIHPDPSQIPRSEGDVNTDMKFVDYFSAACPHCKTLDPAWADAEKKWETDFAEREDAPIISFEKKECYDDHWHPGKDFTECKNLGIRGFPTIKVFTPAADGHGFMQQPDYDGPRTSEGMIDFLKKEAGFEEPAAQASDAHDEHHAVPSAQEEEVRDEPVAAAPIVGKAMIKEVAAAPAANVEEAPTALAKDTKADVPEAFAKAVQTALAPLPIVSLSCLPARQVTVPKRVQRSRTTPLEAPPTMPTQFL